MDFSQLKAYNKKIEKMPKDIDIFFVSVTKNLGARLLRKVKQKTPKGDTSYRAKKDKDGNVEKYKKGNKRGLNKMEVSHKGGNLKRNWQVTDVVKGGNTYIIDVYNQVEYASWVEEGHRQTVGRYVPAIGKKLKQPKTKGRHMLKKSEEELEKDMDKIIQSRWNEFTKDL
ncbi:MAG: HK97 gp10 family phage protein [Anaerotignaceae bacterium]